jgi:phage shock protein PspC (stress-responsive transcriptional regulator)
MSEHAAEPIAAPKRLERSREDRWLAGVCGGLARYFGIHPAFYRVGFVVLTLLGGSGILVYLAAVLVIPKEGEPDSIAGEIFRQRRDRPWRLVALGLLGVAGAVLLSHATFRANGDAAWVLLLLAGAVILLVTRRSRSGEEDSRRVSRLLRVVTLTVAGLVVAALIAAAVFAATIHVRIDKGVGERNYTVASATDLRDRYDLGIGRLNLDLRNVHFPLGTTHLTARVDVGRLDVSVPNGIALQVRGDADFGEVNVPGRATHGHDVHATLDQNGPRVLVLDAHVGAGRLDVKRSLR